jgi:uncharacterized protein with NRDE domain
MCLIAIGLHASRDYPVVVAANRDERHARPTAAAQWWEHPRILGGRDLSAGGTWLAVDPVGRFAAVTNYHDSRIVEPERSRGELVTRFLGGRVPATDFVADLDRDLDRYAGFNLLLHDGDNLCYVSNRTVAAQLGAGVHAFSNSHPAVDWPKVRRVREALSRALAVGPHLDGLLTMLAEPAGIAAREGNPRHALFVRGDAFGTRSSTVLLVRHDGHIDFGERRYAADGSITGETRYEFERSVTS